VSDYVVGSANAYYIADYNQGDMAGVTMVIYQRVIDNVIGYFSHRGQKLLLSGDLETSLGIQDGVNDLVPDTDRPDVDLLMANFLVIVNGEYYFMANIDGNNPPGQTTITLDGPDYYWQTLGAGGTSVSVTIYHYTRESITLAGPQFDLPPHTFMNLDRAGRPIIDQDIEQGGPMRMNKGNVLNEAIAQTEGISFSIEYADGSTETGDI
jgi:hypothetical protein